MDSFRWRRRLLISLQILYKLFPYVVFTSLFWVGVVCRFTSPPMTNALSKLEERYWRYFWWRLGHPNRPKWGSQSSPCERFILCPTARQNTRPCSALHWNLDATFVRIIESGTHSTYLVDWWAFFPITSMLWFQSLHIYDKHCCDVLLACVNRWGSFLHLVSLKTKDR